MTKDQISKLVPHELAKLMRDHVENRGGPALDASGNYIGTAWPMMLRAAEMLDAIKLETRV